MESFTHELRMQRGENIVIVAANVYYVNVVTAMLSQQKILIITFCIYSR